MLIAVLLITVAVVRRVINMATDPALRHKKLFGYIRTLYWMECHPYSTCDDKIVSGFKIEMEWKILDQDVTELGPYYIRAHEGRDPTALRGQQIQLLAIGAEVVGKPAIKLIPRCQFDRNNSGQIMIQCGQAIPQKAIVHLVLLYYLEGGKAECVADLREFIANSTDHKRKRLLETHAGSEVLCLELLHAEEYVVSIKFPALFSWFSLPTLDSQVTIRINDRNVDRRHWEKFAGLRQDKAGIEFLFASSLAGRHFVALFWGIPDEPTKDFRRDDFRSIMGACLQTHGSFLETKM
jgi:hypothetical protein